MNQDPTFDSESKLLSQAHLPTYLSTSLITFFLCLNHFLLTFVLSLLALHCAFLSPALNSDEPTFTFWAFFFCFSWSDGDCSSQLQIEILLGFSWFWAYSSICIRSLQLWKLQSFTQEKLCWPSSSSFSSVLPFRGNLWYPFGASLSLLQFLVLNYVMFQLKPGIRSVVSVLFLWWYNSILFIFLQS